MFQGRRFKAAGHELRFTGKVFDREYRIVAKRGEQTFRERLDSECALIGDQTIMNYFCFGRRFSCMIPVASVITSI